MSNFPSGIPGRHHPVLPSLKASDEELEVCYRCIESFFID
jgi:hypothetical protein